MDNLDTISNRQWLDWHTIIETDKLHPLFVNEKSEDHMYNDLYPETANQYYKALVLRSDKAVITPVDFAAPDATNPKTCVVCEKDKAYYSTLSASGLDHKLTVNDGHSALASVPGEVADALVKIAGVNAE